MRAATQWQQTVADRLGEHVGPGDRMAIAVSGGADSMGLLALVSGPLQVPPQRLVVLYVDHGIRPESRAEGELVKREASELAIEFRRATVDVPAHARDHRLSIAYARIDLNKLILHHRQSV